MSQEEKAEWEKAYDDKLLSNFEYDEMSEDRTLTLKKKYPLDVVKDLIESHDYEDVVVLEEPEEVYYSCQRYFDGADAKESGYTYWIEFHDEYKRGLGKAYMYRFTGRYV